jgi:hypothetical protein
VVDADKTMTWKMPRMWFFSAGDMSQTITHLWVEGKSLILQLHTTVSDFRKPVMGQDSEMAVLVRQLVGVPLEKEG